MVNDVEIIDHNFNEDNNMSRFSKQDSLLISSFLDKDLS
jgi:hypothetical protein